MDGAASHSRRSPARRYRSLFWRVFAVNAVVLALACAMAVVVFSPGTFSSPVAIKELGIFVAALGLMLAADLLLTRRIAAPLEELVTFMRRVDPLRPGVRVRKVAPRIGVGATERHREEPLLGVLEPVDIDP